MWFSTKGRYGMKAVLELARRYGTGPVSIRELAARVDVSATYLEQLFNMLREAQVVCSVRGAQGGYLLARLPQDILVGTVIRALEGSMAPVICAEEGFTCTNSDACIESFLYKRIRQSIDVVIDHMTLQDMLDEENRMKQQSKCAPNCGAGAEGALCRSNV